jgi:uncharacterized protein
VTFVQAVRAVGDPFAIEAIESGHGHDEERVNLVGMCDGVLLHRGGERARVISARRAEKHEQNNYYRANTR